MPSDPQPSALVPTLAQIASLWVLSDLGYYLLIPALGVQPSYNTASVAVTLYYVFWVGIAIITFWPVYATWPRYGRWTTFENRWRSYAVWSVSFAAFVVFATYVLPRLPAITWTESWSPPEVIVANPSFFLPKSVDILFQQLLIVALVLSLSSQNYSLRRISIYCAALFGGTHVLLAYGGVPLVYVVRFMVSAAIFGFIFPYLVLRVRNGLAYSYILHWLYYAISVVLPHIFLASAK